MASFSITKILPYNVNQLTTVIMDIEQYPNFVPWCEKVTIINNENNFIIADVIIKFYNKISYYRCSIRYNEIVSEDLIKAATIEIKMITSPVLDYLYNNWQLDMLDGDKSTKVKFDISISLSSKILNKILNIVFNKISTRIIQAFEKRINDIYPQN